MTLNKTNKSRFVIFCSIAVAVFTMSFTEDLFQVSKNMELFNATYKELYLNYVDDINTSKIFKKGIDAMMNDLDPYTEYIPESEIEDYRLKYVSTQYGGVGASIFTNNGETLISEVYEGYPAQKNGLRPGDQLIAIGGVEVSNKKIEDVSTLLKGAKGTSVKITIKRLGNDALIEKAFIREEIKQLNVSYTITLENNIGYIKLDKFLENSSNEVKEALETIMKNQPTGVVLDLRNNGGGLLGEAVKIVNLFVEKDIDIVAQKGRNMTQAIVYKTNNQPIAPDIPLVVLINAHSASASEIVAGSLQDLDRAVIIGQRSYGKGLVQQTFNLPYNSLIKLTVAKYYIPSGRCIQSLDYQHKDANGTASKIADSLMLEFKTKKGRSVYDGNGIYPDIYLKEVSTTPFIQFLGNNLLIFNYATKYRETNETITSPGLFRLTDAQYEDFSNYVISKATLVYQNTVDKLLKELKKEIDNTKNNTIIKNEYEILRTKLSSDKKLELKNDKKEILKLLEAEIVSRYYFERGKNLYLSQTDVELLKSIQVLNNKVQYHSILEGKGEYKIIGTPKLSAQKEHK